MSFTIKRGEFFVILGTFQASAWLAFFAATTLIFGAAYTLWMVKRVVFGDLTKKELKKLDALSVHEKAYFYPLIVLVLLLGIYPKPVLDILHPAVTHLIAQTQYASGEGEE